MTCLFCQIASGEFPAEIVWRSEGALAFLDHRPLFPGHVLLIPDWHVETLGEMPADRLGAFFGAVQVVERAVVPAMAAEGSFVAMNNLVSQSVPHLHVHIVPRRKGDGLKGFFWPRRKYESDEAMCAAADAIRARLVASSDYPVS
jgi:histidine triad (HIT) family protein